jgi:hypothetical protein
MCYEKLGPIGCPFRVYPNHHRMTSRAGEFLLSALQMNTKSFMIQFFQPFVMDVNDGLVLREVRSIHFPFLKWTRLGWCPEDSIQVKRKPRYLFHLLYLWFHSRLLPATFDIHLVSFRPYSLTISLPFPFYRGFSCSSVHIQVYSEFDCYVG